MTKKKSIQKTPPKNLDLPSDYPESFKNILKSVPKDRRLTVKKELDVVLVRYLHSGPIPSPRDLVKYNEIIPNGADRIMAMAEKQSDHRIEIEKKTIFSQSLQSKIGQIFAFILVSGALYISYSLAMNGHDSVAKTIGGFTVVSIAGVFLTGKILQRKDLRKKQ